MAAGKTQQNKSDQQRAKDGTQAERPAGQDSFAQQDGGNQPDARAVGDPSPAPPGFSNNACIIAPRAPAPPHQQHRRGSRQADLPDKQLTFGAEPLAGRDPLLPAHRLISRVTSSNSVNPKSQRRLRRC